MILAKACLQSKINSVPEKIQLIYNNYTDLSFTPWSEDHEPSEIFFKIVREMQIEPNSYYLEMVMNQSLVNNFAINCNEPKVNTIEQDTPPENEPNRQSPCPSNWSDYLHVEDDTDNESPDQTEPPTNLLLQQVHAYPMNYILTQMPF